MASLRAVSTLRLVMGDQLSQDFAGLRSADKAADVVFLAEAAEETLYAPHHKKKIAFVLSAMRAFADELCEDGWRVDYVTLDDPANTGSLGGEVARAIERHKPSYVAATEAKSWRALEMQRDWKTQSPVPFDIIADDSFICSKAEFAAWAEGRTQLRMEYFYRDMRRRTGLLMDGGEPVGGQWNFDKDNRKPAKPHLFMPRPLEFPPLERTQKVLDLVGEKFKDNFGDLHPFWFAVTRAQAEQAADRFFAESLPKFGDYQDAMLTGAKYLYHSVLSPCLNVGLLNPLDLCRRAEAAYHKGDAPLNSVEGFIRQILGWREYVRGIYWLKMPGYTGQNYLRASRPLPWMYWSGETDMNCMSHAIGQTKQEAYAHHIQRLMITGNFALLAGVRPYQIHEWYLGVYADAFEWVEAPNTIGMSQFADGGLLGSKPYAASGAYIDRMSDYCGACAYNVKEKTGPTACPFNYLYWDFLDRNRDKLQRNARLAQVYKNYDRLKPEQRDGVTTSAAAFLSYIDERGTDLGFIDVD